jgi:hypothetical protein
VNNDTLLAEDNDRLRAENDTLRKDAKEAQRRMVDLNHRARPLGC